MKNNSENNLRTFNFKNTYDSYEDDPFGDFLIPSLYRSMNYSRAVGYFSSAILGVVPEAFTDFAERGGKIKVICSPHLTPRDAEVFTSLDEKSIFQNLNNGIENLLNDGLMTEPLNLLRALIKQNALEIKFAIPHNPDAGIFHQKIGVFEDFYRNFISFSGSNNESISGWLENRNSDRFSVSRGWSTEEYELDIAESTKSAFERMWRNNYPGFEITDFSQNLDFITKNSSEDLDLSEIKNQVKEWAKKRAPQKLDNNENSLRGYQSEVIQSWKENDHEGVICFATGAGKTFTALNAAKYWLEDDKKRSVLILVPSQTLQRQWISEIRKVNGLSDSKILSVGGGTSSDTWKQALTGFTSFSKSDNHRIVVAINDSASSENFIERVAWGNQLMVIADEMHNLGAPSYLNLLESIEAGAILGLSATPERYDDEQNVNLRRVFGNDLKPIIDIGSAQELGFLVPYRYRFKKVHLTDDENQKYLELTSKISKQSAISKNDPNSDQTYLQRLRIQRADILKKATEKINITESILRQEFNLGSSWIIFCNDSEQLDELKARIKDLEPMTYHQKMEGDPKATLNFFQKFGGIMLSIDMLTEGVDIPSVDHCLLIASSQSMREYIQRRGRVLRLNKKKSKPFAEIWDLIVVNEEQKAVNSAEVDRAEEFVRFSLNPGISIDLEKLRYDSNR
jgi:superfamily II DNA or RNA helicase